MSKTEERLKLETVCRSLEVGSGGITGRIMSKKDLGWTENCLWIVFDNDNLNGVESIVAVAESEGEILQKIGIYCMENNDPTYLEVGRINRLTGKIVKHEFTGSHSIAGGYSE